MVFALGITFFYNDYMIIYEDKRYVLPEVSRLAMSKYIVEY